MGNLDWTYLIDAVAALYGLYVLLSSLKMKFTGEISSFVASPEEMQNCTQKEEFAKKASNPMICFGILAMSYGCLNIANTLFWQNKIYDIGSLAIFLLYCVVFIIWLKKARKKYLKI